MERGRETGRDHVRLYQEENHPRQTPLRRWNPFPEHPSVCAWVCVCMCYRDSFDIHIRPLLGEKLCHISIFLPIQVKVQIKIWNTETGSQTRGWRTACKTTQQTLVKDGRAPTKRKCQLSWRPDAVWNYKSIFDEWLSSCVLSIKFSLPEISCQ